MQRYFALDKDLSLDNSDYFHIKNVMRMKTGDLIDVIYDKMVYHCKVKVGKEVKVEVINSEKGNDNNVSVTIAFSLLKEKKLDYVFQKTTELGVDSLIPIKTTRSIIKLDDKKEADRFKRWQKICKESSEQCGRNYIPKIISISTIYDLVKLNYDLKILCTLNEKSRNIKKVIQKNNKCDRILIVIGPEGGFDKEEEKFLIQNHFISTTLGSTVLRAETAPVVALSMLNYEFMR
ncbi:MAG: RsmE family RNA methyltransferase [Bacilli bacterium]